MPRKMKRAKGDYEHEINVIAHIMTKNMWEFYVTDKGNNKTGVAECLVMGFETEYGPADLNEIRPFIISSTKDLEDVMPAPGWKWVN